MILSAYTSEQLILSAACSHKLERLAGFRDKIYGDFWPVTPYCDLYSFTKHLTFDKSLILFLFLRKWELTHLQLHNFLVRTFIFYLMLISTQDRHETPKY